MMIRMFQVDAFTNRLFGGNPAAVCPLSEWLEPQLMQNIAMENNLSETAFYVPKHNTFEIRWFTPKLEIDLAGHPTLAAAHVIFNHMDYTEEEIVFSSLKSGLLKVRKQADLMELDFPARPPEPAEIPLQLTAALGKEPLEVRKGRDFLVRYATEADILSIEPDFKQLAALDCLGVIITAPGDHSDFVSRFFAPQVGVDEDPVTGSAHTILIPYWAEQLNKTDLHAFQLSHRRGELFCKHLGDRVKIAGRAVTYMDGQIRI